MNNNFTVYIHHNLINHKVYVGITSMNPPRLRWQAGQGYKENKHFTAAIEKYGYNIYPGGILSGYKDGRCSDMTVYNKKYNKKYREEHHEELLLKDKLKRESRTAEQKRTRQRYSTPAM